MVTHNWLGDWGMCWGPVCGHIDVFTLACFSPVCLLHKCISVPVYFYTSVFFTSVFLCTSVWSYWCFYIIAPHSGLLCVPSPDPLNTSLHETSANNTSIYDTLGTLPATIPQLILDCMCSFSSIMCKIWRTVHYSSAEKAVISAEKWSIAVSSTYIEVEYSIQVEYSSAPSWTKAGEGRLHLLLLLLLLLL